MLNVLIFHGFFAISSIFFFHYLDYPLHEPGGKRRPGIDSKESRGDSLGLFQRVNDSPQTSLAAVIPKGVDVLQGFITRDKALKCAFHDNFYSQNKRDAKKLSCA